MLSIHAIAEALGKDRSKKQVIHMVGRMHREGVDMADYVQGIPAYEPPLCWHLSWTFTHYVESHPHVGEAVVRAVWQVLKTIENDSVRRDLWRSLTFVPIPEDLSSEVFDAAHHTLASVRYPIAVRAHAMLVAFHIAEPYPELLDELDLSLADLQRLSDSAGIRARAKNLRKEIDKRRVRA